MNPVKRCTRSAGVALFGAAVVCVPSAVGASPGASAPLDHASLAAEALATSGTLAVAGSAEDFSTPGPFPVGVRTVLLPGMRAAEVWYPAVAGSSGTEAYDVRDFVPQAIRQALTTDTPVTVSYAASRDARVADGSFPVVLFSHGFIGMRLQSTFLTAHLASWGMIVASPDHASRDMLHVLGGEGSSDRKLAVDDLSATLDELLAAETRTGDPLAGHVDASRVAAIGHSAGGFTAAQFALDRRVDGYVSLASARNDGQPPDKPSLFVAGRNDSVVEPSRSSAAHQSAAAPTWFVQLDGVGHNGFDDFCNIGGGRGIIGLAEASGLGALLDAQPALRRLGLDGCEPPNVPVADSQPTIRAIVTEWLVALFADGKAMAPRLQATSTALGVTVGRRSS